MDCQDEEPVDYPHGSTQKICNGCCRSQEGNHRIQIDTGQFFHRRHLPQRAHGAYKAQDGDEYGGHGTFVEHGQAYPLQQGIEGSPHTLGKGGHDQRNADQEDPIRRCCPFLFLSHFCSRRIGYGLELGGIGLHRVVPFVCMLHHKEQQGDPDRIAHRIQRQGTAVGTCIHRQSRLHGRHIGGTAHPGSIESRYGAPGIMA